MIVNGEGPTPCDLMFVGEGPGKDEDREGRPFVGASGKELNRYLFRATGRHRTSVFVTNLIRQRVPDDGDPEPWMVRRDLPKLLEEVQACDPNIVVTLGRHSTRHLLGDVDMESVHGIVHANVLVGNKRRVVLPIFHPAAGLHSTELQANVWWGFEQLGRLLKNQLVYRRMDDEVPDPYYEELKGGLSSGTGCCAVDTEGSSKHPWCLSVSNKKGWAAVVRRGIVNLDHIILHNSLHDIGVLRAMQVEYNSFDDTMIKAYLLGVEPQGLKALAYRWAGMEMQSYEELTKEANERHASNYIAKVMEWVSKRQHSASTASSATGTKIRHSISGRGGRKSSKISRKASKR